MKLKPQAGFNVVGMIAVVFVIFLLVAALFPFNTMDVRKAQLSAVGIRGTDVFRSIVEANAERKVLALLPIWPSDEVILATTNQNDVVSMDFKSSTEYFRWLIDENNLNTEQWNPYVAGFDYNKLAGADVPACHGRPLESSNNMWTVIKNYHGDMPDTTPVLITRNVDAASLVSKVTEIDLDKRLRFDPEFKMPFGNKDFVFIRKSGAVFIGHNKQMTCRTVYGEKPFDATVDAEGKPLGKQLKYLTPTHEVVPGRIGR